MSELSAVVHTDPEILGGTPIFVGTRVPFRALIDYLEATFDAIDEIRAGEVRHIAV